jgi:hypothetical protein
VTADGPLSEVVDARRELRPRVHSILGGGEVVLVTPVLSQVLHEREWDALGPVVDGLALRPPRVPQARAEVFDGGGIERHPERNEVWVLHGAERYNAPRPPRQVEQDVDGGTRQAPGCGG